MMSEDCMGMGQGALWIVLPVHSPSATINPDGIMGLGD